MRPGRTKASPVGLALTTLVASVVVIFGSSTSSAAPGNLSTATAEKQSPSSGAITLGPGAGVTSGPEEGVNGASEAAERVRQYAQVQHVNVFAGVSTQNNGNMLQINLTSDDALARKLLVQASGLANDQISFTVVHLSTQQQNDLFEKTVAQWDSLSKIVTVREVMQDDAASDVYVRTVDASPEQLAAVSALLDANVRLINDSSKVAETHPAGRQDDTPGYYGGDFIQSSVLLVRDTGNSSKWW